MRGILSEATSKYSNSPPPPQFTTLKTKHELGSWPVCQFLLKQAFSPLCRSVLLPPPHIQHCIPHARDLSLCYTIQIETKDFKSHKAKSQSKVTPKQQLAFICTPQVKYIISYKTIPTTSPLQPPSCLRDTNTVTLLRATTPPHTFPVHLNRTQIFKLHTYTHQLEHHTHTPQPAQPECLLHQQRSSLFFRASCPTSTPATTTSLPSV